MPRRSVSIDRSAVAPGWTPARKDQLVNGQRQEPSQARKRADGSDPVGVTNKARASRGTRELLSA